MRGDRQRADESDQAHARPTMVLPVKKVQPMNSNQTKPISFLMFTVRSWMLNVAVLATGAGSAFAAVHYVDVNSIKALPPYTNWTTAATNIQDAVDAAMAGDEILVT